MNSEKKRTYYYLLIAVFLLLIFINIPALDTHWQLSAESHSIVEILGGFIALTVGFSSLFYFYGFGNRFYLLIGFGFLISGSMDLFHGILAIRNLMGLINIEMLRFFPYTYVAGRGVLAIMLIIASIAEPLLNRNVRVRSETLILSIAAIFLGSGLVVGASMTTLPRIIYPGSLIPRPMDLITSVLFLSAFLSLLKRYKAREDYFTGFLALSALINFGGEIYTTFSKQIFDVLFDLGFILKMIGYLVPMLGIAGLGLTETRKARKELKLREETEIRLTESEKNLVDILLNITDGIVVTERNKNVSFINTKGMELLGYVPQSNDSMHLDELFINCDKEKNEIIDSIVSGRIESLHNIDLKVITPIKKTLSVSGSELINLNRETDRIVLMIHDVTKEKEIDRMKTEFVSNVSHELRTPLTSIVGFSKTLLKTGEIDEETRLEFIQIIYDESKRLSNLIEDLLSISRIESGGTQFKMEMMDLRVLVSEVYDTYKVRAKEKGLDFTFQYGEDIPQITADKNAIKQVVINLVGNALKYTEKGKIDIFLNRREQFCEIAVKDTGMGIPEEDRGRIFEKFYRVYRPELQIQGTGLGLAITREIVEGHNGKIELSAGEDTGSVFTVFLPIDQNSTKEERNEDFSS